MHCQGPESRYWKPLVRLFLMNCISKALHKHSVVSVIHVVALGIKFIHAQDPLLPRRSELSWFLTEIWPFLKKKIKLKHLRSSQHYFSNVFVAILPSIHQIIYQNVVPSTLQFHNANRGKKCLHCISPHSQWSQPATCSSDMQHQTIQPLILQGCHFDITLAYPQTDLFLIFGSAFKHTQNAICWKVFCSISCINLPFLQILYCNVHLLWHKYFCNP